MARGSNPSNEMGFISLRKKLQLKKADKVHVGFLGHFHDTSQPTTYFTIKAVE